MSEALFYLLATGVGTLMVTMVLMLLLERWREDRVHGGL